MSEAMADNKREAPDDEIGLRESLAVVGRALSYIKYFKTRFALKCFFVGLGLMTPLVLPWPIKIVIDNVILERAIDPGAYPWYFQSFVSFLDGRSAMEMMIWIVALGIAMILLFGAFGTGSGIEEVRVELAQGHDIATQTENAANMAHSKFAGLIGYVEYHMQLRLSQGLNHLLRAQLFERIQRLPMSTLSEKKIGDSMYRLMYDTTSIGDIFYQVLISSLLSIFGAIVVLSVMWSSYGNAPEVVWLAMLVLPVQVLAILPFPKLIRRRSRASRAAGAATTANIEEGMSNVLAVQSLGGNHRERARFHRASTESFRRHRKMYLAQLLLYLSRAAATGAVGLVAFFVISERVIDGVLSPGDFGVLLYYFGWLAGTLAYLPFIWPRIQNDVPGIRRVFNLMDLPGEADRPGRDIGPVSERLEMRNVGFIYPDGRRALADINLTCEVGKITALVGPTGAGKSSLAMLIPGLLEASEGIVSLDGVNAADIAIESLRKQVSYVFQETQLFSDSIFENIRYGNPNATIDEVERVARIAGAHSFISELPEGYETLLGTVTSKLSVGQKQRIAISRGLIKESSILVLDEPTSALDPETEAFLVTALQEAAQRKLVILIAHRLSTIAHADQIVFLEDGRIREVGTHEELLRSNGAYSEFVRIQAGD